MSELFQIVALRSGINTLRTLEHQETFHPGVGPMQEARHLHVDQHQFLKRIESLPAGEPLIIWDVGLGAAANAIAILEYFQENPIPTPVELHSFDRSRTALEFALQHDRELEYITPWIATLQTLLQEKTLQIQNVRWAFHEGDFRETVSLPQIPPPHSTIFDPYSPQSNPELWIIEVFQKLREKVGERHCLLTSYSRSTSVRTTLLFAGWFIGSGSATGNKEETSLAATHLSLLEKPLPCSWLQRVSKSHKTGPLTATLSFPQTAIEIVDLLRKHPQFLHCDNSMTTQKQS